MTHNNIEDNIYENQLLVSFELICLIKWILENEDEKIKKIIIRALNSGLQEELNKKTILSKEAILDDIQCVLFDFFDMMEALLMESVGEQAVKRVIEKNLMPAIDRIDSSVCDDETVRFSIEKTASKLEHNYIKSDYKSDCKNNSKNCKNSCKSVCKNTCKNDCDFDIDSSGLIENYPATPREVNSKEKAKKILMTELLKNWKPKGKSVIN